MRERLFEPLGVCGKTTIDYLGQCADISAPAPAENFKPFFDVLLSITHSAYVMAQNVLIQSSFNDNGSIFTGLSDDKREMLISQIKKMVGKISDKETKINYHKYCELYEKIGYGNAVNFVESYNKTSNSCYIEIHVINTLFNTSGKKLPQLLSLIQVIQFLEPAIMEALMGIIKNIQRCGGTELAFPDGNIPDYILAHKKMQNSSSLILQDFYGENEIPDMVDGYCTDFLRYFNVVFQRVNELTFGKFSAQANNNVPGVSE